MLKNLAGMAFGRLSVIGRAPHETRFGRLAAWLCRCECGKEKAVVGPHLRSGAVRSCGCLLAETTRARRFKHGLCKTREYRSWSAAKTRCDNPRQRSYRDYGARGISMCPEWRADFAAFLRDMGPCPIGHSIDRIDNDRHYEPGNCRWAPALTQANNTRTNRLVTFRGETHSVSGWARILGLQANTLKQRLRRGWPTERALTTPLH